MRKVMMVWSRCPVCGVVLLIAGMFSLSAADQSPVDHGRGQGLPPLPPGAHGGGPPMPPLPGGGSSNNPNNGGVTAQSEPAPPGGGGGGGGGPLVQAPPYSAAGLKLFQPVFVGTNLQFTILEGATNAQYDLFHTPVLNFPLVWFWLGRTETNAQSFEVPAPITPEGYFLLGTMLDSDGDGLTDAFERLVSLTLPTAPDSDTDGLPDGWEVAHNLNPNDPADALLDSDGDGHVNLDEFILGQNPQAPDPPLPAVTLFVQDGTLAEAGADSATVLLLRGGDTNRALTVYYSLGGAARSGQDYQPLPGEVTFAAGVAVMPVVIQPLDDAAFEGPETVIFSLLPHPAYLFSDPDTVTLTLLENDLPEVSAVAVKPAASEAGATGEFTLQRTGSTTAPLTVLLNWNGSTATAGADYAALPGAVTLEIGQRSTNLVVQPVQDTDYEGVETVVLTLTPQAGYLIGAGTATVTIADDDLPVVTVTASDADAREAGLNPGRFTLTRTGSTAQALAVPFRVGGTALNDTDYEDLAWNATIPAGAASVDVAVTPKADAELEFLETVVLTVAGSTDYNLGTNHSATVLLDDANPPFYEWRVVKASAVTNAAPVINSPGIVELTRKGSALAAASLPWQVLDGNGYTLASWTYQIRGAISGGNVVFPAYGTKIRVELLPDWSTPYVPGVLFWVPAIMGGGAAHLHFLESWRYFQLTVLRDGVEGGQTAQVRLTRLVDGPAMNVTVGVGGLAAPQEDHNWQASQGLTFYSGYSYLPYDLTPTADGTVEGWESVVLSANPDAADHSLAVVNPLLFLREDSANPDDLPAGDTDGDGLPDRWELSHGMDPLTPDEATLDLDGDGLSTREEADRGTDPNNPDTDGNGMNDYRQLYADGGPDRVFVKLRSLDTGKTASGSCATCHISQLRVGAVSHYDRRDMLNTPTETVLTFLKGQSYPVTVRNLANNLPSATGNPGAPTTDARYTQQILPLGALPEFIVRDPQGLLGESLVWSAAAVAAKSATLIVPKVELTWQASGNNLALDDHTNALTGEVQGKRIFVGALTPTEGLTRNTVMLKIKVTPPLPGTNVFLKAFDVDDTTDETFDRVGIGGGVYEAVIDSNGKAGNDNFDDYLSTPKSGLFVSTGQPTNTVTLDANSEVLVEFHVGMQPGNNYRIAATVFATNNLSSLQVVEPTALYFVSVATDQVRGGFNGAVSPILTVWRKLHLEIDSMTAPPATGPESGRLTGTIYHVQPNHPKTGLAMVWIRPDPTGPAYDRAQYADGSLEIVGTTNIYPVVWNEAFVTIEAPASEAAGLKGQPFILRDDDDRYLTDDVMFRSVLQLPSPPLPMHDRAPIMLDGFDRIPGMRALYRSAFIDIVDASQEGMNGVQTIPFKRNAPVFSLPLFNSDFDVGNLQLKGTDTGNFWAFSVAFGYEYVKDDDGDPDVPENEPLKGGTPETGTFNVPFGYSVIFMESIREHAFTDEPTVNFNNIGWRRYFEEKYYELLITVTAHELGHAPGRGSEDSDHAEGRLMQTGAGPGGLDAKTVKRFRTSASWTGSAP